MVISSKIKIGCTLKDYIKRPFCQSWKANDKQVGQKLQHILPTEELLSLIYEELLCNNNEGGNRHSHYTSIGREHKLKKNFLRKFC